MGFRNGAYATVFKVDPKTPTMTTMSIAISRKNKETGEYETDFSGFVACVGTAAAKKAADLMKLPGYAENSASKRPVARIKLGDTDVSTTYVKEKNTTYTNYKMFDFELTDAVSGNSVASVEEVVATVDEIDDEGIPF